MITILDEEGLGIAIRPTKHKPVAGATQVVSPRCAGLGRDGVVQIVIGGICVLQECLRVEGARRHQFPARAELTRRRTLSRASSAGTGATSPVSISAIRRRTSAICARWTSGGMSWTRL